MPQGGSYTRDFSYGLGDVVEATKSAGATLGGILKDRLDRKEYDDFLQGPNKDFSNTLRQAQDLMMDESNPDAATQGIRMLHIGSQQLFDEAGKYPNNPYVAQRANQVFSMNMEFLKQEFVMQHQNAMMARQQKLDAATIEAKGSEVLKNKSIAAKNLGSADLAGARAEDLAMKNNPYLSGLPGTVPGADDDAKADNLWTAINTRGANPLNPTQRAAIDIEKSDERMNIARNRIFEMAARGEKRTVPSKTPGGIPDVHTYDPHNKSDLEAVAATIDQSQIDASWAMKVAQREAAVQGIKDPSVLERKFGVLVDPTKASAFNPITKPTTEQNVGKIMFGIGGWSQLYDPNTKAEPKTIEEAATRLPDDLNKVSGPIADLFRQMPVLAKDENIKSLADLKMQLWQHGKEVVDKTFGNGVDYDKLDEGMKRNRQSAATLVQAMTNKYADQIAERMGIVRPKPKQKGLTDQQVSHIPGLDDLLQFVGASSNKVKRLYQEYTD